MTTKTTSTASEKTTASSKKTAREFVRDHRHGGKPFKAGEKIELTAAESKKLEALGVLKPLA